MKRMILAAVLSLSGVDAAFAHAQLQSASPPVGGAVAAPQEIRLTFSEGVEPKFSSIALSGPGGAIVTGAAATAAGDNHTLVVKIGHPLAPGSYSVKWRVTSTDTHRTQGGFDFTVK